MTATRFHLAVDDGGELFVASGDRLVMGHLRAPDLDLPFLADVELEHAVLALSESFHSGPRWTIERSGSGRVRVDGADSGGRPVVLADGARVELASNLAFRFHAPDPSSASAVLELQGGAECEGARRILLLAPDAAGRVRIGRASGRHVQVQDLVHDVSLELSQGALLVRCIGIEHAVPCPPAQLVALSFLARGLGRPPLGITLWPVRMDAPSRA